MDQLNKTLTMFDRNANCQWKVPIYLFYDSGSSTSPKYLKKEEEKTFLNMVDRMASGLPCSKELVHIYKIDPSWDMPDNVDPAKMYKSELRGLGGQGYRCVFAPINGARFTATATCLNRKTNSPVLRVAGVCADSGQACCFCFRN